jgi:hypothetical protein
MKYLFMLSTGRTGTKKLGEVFSRLPGKRVIAEHQVAVSRKIDILANLYWWGAPVSAMLHGTIHNFIKKERKCDLYVNTDPLISGGLNERIAAQYDLYLIHLVRHPLRFAQSFINLQFSRFKSFMAHNFIPFWQPTVRPFEHVVHHYRRDYMIDKYIGVWMLKNKFYHKTYSKNERYIPVCFERLFDPLQAPMVLNRLLDRMDLLPCEIDFDFFHRKSNISTAKYISNQYIEGYTSPILKSAVKFYEKFKSIGI